MTWQRERAAQPKFSAYAGAVNLQDGINYKPVHSYRLELHGECKVLCQWRKHVPDSGTKCPA